MQLVAYGAQDVYLTGSPKITFFSAQYRRHTNFSMETIEQTVNGTAASSGRVSVTVARNGDLVGEMYLELTTKDDLSSATSAKDVNWVAERAVSSAELSVGGQRIDRLHQRWWRIYAEVYLDAAAKQNYAKMTTGIAGAASKVYLPLLFAFNLNPGLALPLISLQYHEVRIDIDLASDFETFFSTSGLKVHAQYYFLDTDERRRFAQRASEMLITQVQHTGVDAVTDAGTKNVRLSLNHPVKALHWVCNGGTAKSSLWNFTADQALTSVVLESNASAIATSNAFISPADIGCPLVKFGTGGSAKMPTERGTATAKRTSGPLSEFKLILNGQDRMKAMDGAYFNSVQAAQHWSGSPMPGIYSYSFALKPEEHQPSGSCNFSRIDNAQVAVTLKDTTTAGSTTTNLSLFALGYNVLRIQSGMAGLAFSN